MGRAPCCDKIGLKKGPWTPEEDQILIDYIQEHGHGSWRTIPKNAGMRSFLFECIGYSISILSVSRLLGIQPLVNPELLMLATTLLSSQRENQNFILQNLQENQLCNSQVPNQFQSYQPNQFQTPMQEIPVCTTSSAPFLNQTQIAQTNLEQFPSNSTTFNCPDSEPNMWQDNGIPSNLMENLVSLPNYDYNSSDQPMVDPLSNVSNFQYNNNSNKNFSLASVMPTPSSSPTPLNSSSTNINSSTEDERDSYCSNMLKFEIPDILDLSEFM
ncbi:hypothetical protein HHK36_023736 [Tetracentron sinense]|uniref:Uncharacterized protein n=1 Tax=Tetracentron sinense TaxID=13715 RepID=A0A834YTQ8_TETSI|nr:hypothetical protein HHK36_023736 [Tetracentron sinense]